MLIEEGTLLGTTEGGSATADLAGLRFPARSRRSRAASSGSEAEQDVLEGASVDRQVFWKRGRRAGRRGGGPVVGSPRLLVRGRWSPAPTAFAGERGYRFGHILMRDVAYRRLLKGDARCPARALRPVGGRKAGARLAEYEEIVGYHLEQAHRYRAELGPRTTRAGPWRTRPPSASGRPASAHYERGDTQPRPGCSSGRRLCWRRATSTPPA